MQGSFFKKPQTKTPSEVMNLLENLHREKLIDDAELALACFFGQREGINTAPLLAAAAWLSWANRQGHTSIDLAEILHNPDLMTRGANDSAGENHIPVFADWAENLSGNEAVGEENPGGNEPLVLCGNRLYFRRMYEYEVRVARSLLNLAENPAGIPKDVERIKKRLQTLFDAGPESRWQKAACVNALNRRLTIITGGPGTGKTHTVLRLMALLLESDTKGEQHIALAAPTGKAAARVRESIMNGLEQMELSDEVRERIPMETRTLHRLLGNRYRSAQFRFNRENPLPYTVVIVDEASMIDLPMMAKLLDALRDDARLILLGDKNQLASVEAGSVFADLCGPGLLSESSREFIRSMESFGISMDGVKTMESVSPIRDCTVQLTYSRRFGADSGIGRLAAAINQGDEDAVVNLLSENEPEIEWIGESGFPDDTISELRQQFEFYLGNQSPENKLGMMRKFQVLCGHRRGRLGVEQINRHIEKLLGLQVFEKDWYAGRPAIMTRNDYELGIFNGDTGLCIEQQDGEEPELRVIMEHFDEGRKRLSVLSRHPAQLSEMETCWALSVHKSQGSEYGTVALVLPEKPSPVITRELIYTAVTRARDKVIISGSERLIRHAVTHPTYRSGGLRSRLHSPSN